MTEINGAVYLFGGMDAGGALRNDLWKFANDAWTPEIQNGAPGSPAPRQFHSAAASGGKMYIFYGLDAAFVPLSDIWSYNPADNSWKEEMVSSTVSPGRRFWHQTVGLPDGRILLYGGLLDGFTKSDPGAWLYNPATGTWESKSLSPGGSFFSHSAVAISDKVYTFGGFDCTCSSIPGNALWRYDVTTDSWSSQSLVPPESSPPSRAFTAIAKGSILIFGGENPTSPQLDDTWKFDTTTNTWTQGANLPIPLDKAQAASIPPSQPNGVLRVLVFGGTAAGGVPSTSTFLYFPAGAPAPSNQPPVANADSYSTGEDVTLIVGSPGVLGNDTDADGNQLTAVVVTGPSNGTLTLNSNGSFTYTPNPSFFGVDSFTYKANDDALDSNIATVTITVTPGLAGRMEGDGHIDQNGQRHRFEFHVRERANGEERGRLQYRVRPLRPGRNHDGDDGHGPVNRFVSTEIPAIAFSDDPTVTPGKKKSPNVDTVVFRGTGRWNGASGYTFEARAVDAGEPGRGRDQFMITVKDPSGNVVSTVTGMLTGGNIQSHRIRHP